MLKKLLCALLLVCACSSKPVVPEIEPMAESTDKTVTADFGSQFWTEIPVGNGIRWEKIDEGVDTSDDATTHIKASGLSQDLAPVHFETEDAPADLDVLTEIKFRFRGWWRWAFVNPTDFRIQFEFYTDAGATLIGTMIIDLEDITPAQTWHTYPASGFYSLTGLSLDKIEADDLTVRMVAHLPDFPDKNDQILLSAFDFRYVYSTATVPEGNQVCIGGEFRTAKDFEAGFDMERNLSAEFSTTVFIVGSVPLELLSGQVETVLAPIVALPAVTSDAINEVCMSGQFVSVVVMSASFNSQQSLSASVPEC